MSLDKIKLEHENYPQVSNREYPIKDMSIGYLKTQIEKITRTEINSDYLNDLKAEYAYKTRLIFKQVKYVEEFNKLVEKLKQQKLSSKPIKRVIKKKKKR